MLSLIKPTYVLRLAIAGQIQSIGEEETDSGERAESVPESVPTPPSSLTGSGNGPASFGTNGAASGPAPGLQELLKQPANRVCADCADPDPSWVSLINLEKRTKGRKLSIFYAARITVLNLHGLNFNSKKKRNYPKAGILRSSEAAEGRKAQVQEDRVFLLFNLAL